MFVEYRAATLGEVRAIDVDADEVVLPAYVLLSQEQWSAAVSPFPIGPRGQVKRPWRAPGRLIWAQLASRLGDRIVGGRDSSGLPSIPVPTESGSIRFMAAVPGGDGATDRDETARGPGSRIPSMLMESHLGEPSKCEPVLSLDGPIVCNAPDCDDGCLQALTRTSWNTTIACFCGG